MFLVSLKACNNLFSLNKKTTKNPLNKTLTTTKCRKLTRKQFCRSFRGLKTVTFVFMTAMVVKAEL